MTEIFFEKYQVPGLYLCKDAVLSAYDLFSLPSSQLASTFSPVASPQFFRGEGNRLGFGCRRGGDPCRACGGRICPEEK